jgi:radical SAM superfamily enzyme YgiQ (UPF0313 family)
MFCCARKKPLKYTNAFKMPKKNLYLVQIPLQFKADTTPVYFPYSIGMLWSYARTFPEIDQNYDLKEIIFLKESIDVIVARLDDPGLVALSCYIWNLNFTMQLAKRIKEKFPDCVLVAGGPSVPVNDDSFLDQYHWIDLLVYREGEIVFKDLLVCLAQNTDFSEIAGLAYKKNGKLHRTAAAQRVENLDLVPSPYLTGIFDGMQDHAGTLGITVNGIIETNRGCPFSCTFCDWGNGTLGKVKRFDLRRVKKELLWMARNQVAFITNCDANFGIYKERDMAICQFMTRLKKRYGYPKLFDTNWHKNNNENTVEMAKHLMEHGMLRRFTSSIQSQNTVTLQAIKRRNLSDKNIGNIVDYADSLGLITLTELIIGLPGETYQSFQKSYVNLIEKGMIPTASPLIILPNSEMNDAGYRRKYGFVTKINRKSYTHVDEIEEMVIGTNTMPTPDYERLVLWCWFVQQFHFHGYTNVIFDFFKKYFQWNMITFYDRLLDLVIEDRDCLPNLLISPLRNHVSTGKSNMLTLGAVNYDLHEKIGGRHRQEFYRDLKNLIRELAPEHTLVDDLLVLQDYNQAGYDREQIEMFEVNSNLWDVLYHNQDLVLEPRQHWVKQERIDKTRHKNFGEFVVNERFTQQWRTTIESYEPHLS